MRSFIQLYIANIREFVRDTSALFWMIAFPVMFILIFGVIFSSEDDVSFSIGLVNEDGEASARLVEGFEAIEAFDLHTGEREEELAELEDGDRSAVIVIPEGTGRAIGEYFDQLSSTSQQAALTQAPLEVYYDPSNQTRSQIVLNIIDQIIAEMNEGMTGIRPALAIEPRTVTADNLRSIDYLLPGILGMSLMQLGLFGTAGPLVSLREKGVLRRMGATPLSRVALLSSQVAFRLTTAVIQTGLIIAVGMIAFDVQIKIENLPVILGIVLLGASMFITLGYFLSG
ncbi:MAG: ABC transporter permease, partial [Chloroflexi bacterium]|nr:ABC transporter permease [Chloroflexota bacterium]